MLERIAYHEAGHVVAFFELGRKIRKVTIRPGKDYSGRCFDYTTLGFIEELSYRNTPYARQRMQDEVVLYFAGHVAEAEFLKGKKSKIEPLSWDRGVLSMAAQTVSKEEYEAYLDWLYIRTEVLITKPNAWKAIQAIVQELLKKKTLSGKEAFQIWNNVQIEEIQVLDSQTPFSLIKVEKG